MTTKRHQIEVRGIQVDVVRKDIKNLHLGVYPPKGRVRVAVPLRLDDEAVRLAVISRLGWIRRQQNGFDKQDRQSQREMITGESHYVQGRRYRLDVIEHDGPGTVNLLSSKTLELRVHAGMGRDQREALLHRWYRQRLRLRIPQLIAAVGARDRRDGGPVGHQADEDPLGNLQRRRPANLAEPGIGQEAGVLPGIHPGA